MVDEDFVKELGPELRSLDQTVDGYDGVGSLQLLPIGLYACLMAVTVGGWLPVSAQRVSIVEGLGLAFAVAGYWMVARSNRGRHGKTPESWPDGRGEIRKWAVAWAGAAAYVLVGIATVPWPIGCGGAVAGLSSAIWLLVRWRRVGTMGALSYSLSGLLIIGALIDPGSGTWPMDAYVLLALIGSVLIAVAITVESRLIAIAISNSRKED